jgi:hypothetical protein
MDRIVGMSEMRFDGDDLRDTMLAKIMNNNA